MGGGGKLISGFEKDIRDEFVAAGIKVESVTGGRADWLNRKIAAAQDRWDREFARIAGVAEAVFKTTDGHVGEFADRVVDDIVACGFEFGLAHAEELAGAQPGEWFFEVKVNQSVHFPDETHGTDNIKLAILGGHDG